MQFFSSLITLAVVIGGTQAFPIGFGLEVRKLSNPDCAAVSASSTAASSAVATAAASSAVASATAAASAAATAAAAASTAATGGSVLTAAAYNDIQISSGTAGNAKANAAALFAKIDQTNLAGVSAADLKTIQGTHDAAEDAEVQAFNPAIAAASGDAATALQNGKIANKVLKLTAEVLGLQIQQAQGKDTADDIAAETTKLNNNIALDTKAAGQAQTAVSFDETT